MRQLIADGAQALQVPLDPAAVDRLERLLTSLLRWNERINVVARCSPREAVDRHIHDGLALLRLLDAPEVLAISSRWVDVGCGAGLPGLVLAAARPELELHLVEPIGKKIAFARRAKTELALDNVTIQSDRVEALEPGRHVAAMSRATFAPERWAAIGNDLVGPGGLVLVMMGSGAPQPLIDAAWRTDRCELPLSKAGRVNVLLRGVG